MDSTVIYSIYKATNIINGKSYIGFTGNFDKRIGGHKTDSEKGKNKLYKAIRKYGWDNFEWSIIYQSFEREYTLNQMEGYFIEQYDSYKNGYNETKGGEGTSGIKQSVETISKRVKLNTGKKRTEESKNKIRIANLGKTFTEDHKNKIRLAKLGSKHTEESKKKMSLSRTGKKLSPEHIENVRMKHIGSKRSEETKEKMREAQRLRWAKRKTLLGS